MNEKIDLNTADEATLAHLPGIGDVLAERIIAYRETVRPFEELIELTAVPGISERMVRELETQLTVTPPSPATAEATALADTAVVVVAGAERTPSDAEADTAGESETVPPDSAAAASPTAAAALDMADSAPATADAAPDATAPTSDAAEPPPDAAEPPPDAAEPPPDAAEPPPDAAEPPLGAAPDTVAPPPPPAIPVLADRNVQQDTPASGWIRGGLLVLFGALVGLTLTVAFLYLLNGTLRFTGNAEGARLQQDVDVQGRAQEQLRQELDAAMAEAATAMAGQATLSAALATAERGVQRVDDEVIPAVATLEAQASDLESSVGAVATTAADFDAFLDGLRDLLLTLQGPAASSTPQATVTATTTPTVTPAAQGTGTATPPVTPTGTAAATRTPRPTATPLN
jgi:hypothetical protein